MENNLLIYLNSFLKFLLLHVLTLLQMYLFYFKGTYIVISQNNRFFMFKKKSHGPSEVILIYADSVLETFENRTCCLINLWKL